MEKLGIDSTLIVVQMINFGLLLLVLKKVLYKPVIKALKEREEKLSEINDAKSKMDKNRQEFDNEKAHLLKSLASEKNRIEKEVTEKAEVERKTILQKANNEAKEIIKNAQKEVGRQVERKTKELEGEMRNLALDSAKAAISDFMDKETQEKSIKKAASILEKIKFDGGNK